MKKVLMAAVAVALVAMAGSAMAATNTLTVSASVVGTCRFSSTSSTLSFGPLDPSVGTDVNGSGTTQFWCTKGVAESISANNGSNWNGTSRRMMDTVSGEFIQYSLTLTKDGSTNLGPTSPRTLTISGTVVGTDYTGKSAGSYSDTVTLTITP